MIEGEDTLAAGTLAVGTLVEVADNLGRNKLVGAVDSLLHHHHHHHIAGPERTTSRD